MSSKPSPRNAENAAEAEARLKSLRGRFGRVSKTIGRSAPSTGAPRQGSSLSKFEVAILASAGLFLLAVVATFLG